MPRFRAAGAGDISLGGISMYIEIKAVSIMLLQSEKKVRLEWWEILSGQMEEDKHAKKT